MNKIDIKTKEGKRLIILLTVMGISLLAFSSYILLRENKTWRPITDKVAIGYGDELDLNEDIFISKEDQESIILIKVDLNADKKKSNEKVYQIHN